VEVVSRKSESIRATELEALTSRFQAAHGSVALIHGRRGVGKAALVDELIRAVADAKPLILVGRTPSVGGKSFHPFAEIAQDLMRWAEENHATDRLLDPLYGDLAPVLDQTATGDQPSLDQKLAFFDAFRRLLIGASERARLLVVVRDLEHADSDTLELSSYLADELFGDPALDPQAARPGLLVLSVRDDTSTPDRIRDFIAEMRERSAVHATHLEGLDLDGLKKYIQSPHVLAKLLSASEGLPQEIDAIFDGLPANVEELFSRKLHALEEMARRALRALSISSRPTSARLLAKVSSLPLRDIAKAMNDLKESRIVERKIHNGEFHFAFMRPRDMEVTRGSIPAEEQEILNGAWAAALTHEPDSGPALLAHHHLRSREPQLGVPLAVQAAETYAVSGAFDLAVQALEDARPHASGELRLSLLHRLAELAPLTGHAKSALRHVEEWKSLLPESARGPALIREAELENACGDHEGALAALELARRVIPGSATLERAAIETKASEARYHLGELAEARAHGERGLEILDGAAADHAKKPRIELLNQLGKIALAGDDLDHAIQLFEETHRLADDAGLVREQAGALVNLGTAHLKRGDAKKAERHLLDGIEKARAARDLWRLAFGQMNLGVVYHQAGELGGAIECYRECKSLFRRLGNRTQLARVLHNLGNLYLLCGDLDRAKAHNDEALRLARATGVERVVAIAVFLDGSIACERGQLAEGEARLREAMVKLEKLGAERPIEAMVELVELQLRTGDLDRAQATLSEVEDALRSIESPLLQARADIARAKLTADVAEASRLLARARAELERRQRRLLVRDVEIEVGRLHQRKGQLETARMHFGAAIEIQSGVASELPSDLREKFLAARPQQVVHTAMNELSSRPATRSSPAIPAEPEPTMTPAPAKAERKGEWHEKYASIVGSSPKLNRVFHIIDRVADSEGTVLICGESGTGKELVAEAIHRSSPRSRGPFVKLNCAALVETLLLSELFGHEKGSFTGAHQRKIGRFEMAAGGTLFLDEIGDISPKTQVALLRVLQEREFERVGGGRPIKVEARIIFATNRNLAQMVRDGTFREDLYYRLKGLTIDLPPLRERPEDIVALSRHFLALFARETGAIEKALSAAAVELLQSYAWPGNIRELENIIRSVALFCEGRVIDVRDFDEYRELFHQGPAHAVERPRIDTGDLPVVKADPSPPPVPLATPPPPIPTDAGADVDSRLLKEIFQQGVPLPELKKRIQEQAIARALRMTGGNITRAAEVLGMRRPRLSQIINSNDELKSLCQPGVK
jgi:transcriptional regulator with GAF, ATPase, and Fis domain